MRHEIDGATDLAGAIEELSVYDNVAMVHEHVIRAYLGTAEVA